MLKQKDLTPEEQSEVFRLADRMQREEHQHDQEARSAAAAAEEMGVSQEYLDRAAAIVHAERVEKIQRQRRRRTIGIVTAVAVVGIGGIAALTPRLSTPTTTSIARPAAAAFTVSLAQTDEATTVKTGADASFETTGDSLQVRIDRFEPGATNYQTNVGYSLPQPLAGQRQFTMTLKGDGVRAVRVDLRDGDQRWNSPPISLSPQGSNVTVRFDQLHRQVRQGNRWVDAPGGGPATARKIVFKLGSGVNPPDTRGAVTIGDLRFE